MINNSLAPGIVAVACFLLFTGIGACAQVLKLARRTRQWRVGELPRDQVCEGLHPVREMWSFTAFLLFALSGLTRTYLDYFLVVGRLPVVLLSSVILWYLQFHEAKNARRYFCFALAGLAVLAVTLALSLRGLDFGHSNFSALIDLCLSAVSLLLFYGKLLQAVSMYRQRKSQAVSWLREAGLVVKDATGLWYSTSVGAELLWVSLTHLLSGISSLSICVVKWRVERRSGPDES